MHLDQADYPGDTRTRRKQQDERRMQFRRAIEDREEERRLQLAIAEYPELIVFSPRASAPLPSARPARGPAAALHE